MSRSWFSSFNYVGENPLFQAFTELIVFGRLGKLPHYSFVCVYPSCHFLGAVPSNCLNLTWGKKHHFARCFTKVVFIRPLRKLSHYPFVCVKAKLIPSLVFVME